MDTCWFISPELGNRGTLTGLNIPLLHNNEGVKSSSQSIWKCLHFAHPPPPGLNFVKMKGSFYILYTPLCINQMDEKTEWGVLSTRCPTTLKTISEDINSFFCNWQFVLFMYWLMQIGATSRTPPLPPHQKKLSFGKAAF